jgi:hypothetical protein
MQAGALTLKCSAKATRRKRSAETNAARNDAARNAAGFRTMVAPR